MKNISKVAVLGGGGRTGKYLVNQLLKNGFSVKLLLRNPDNFTIQNSKIEIIEGDAINEESIKLLLRDCQAKNKYYWSEARRTDGGKSSDKECFECHGYLWNSKVYSSCRTKYRYPI